MFDRGFACPSIVKHLAQRKHIFYIRIKGGKHVLAGDNAPCRTRDVAGNDVAVRTYGLPVRLITSDDPQNGNEPWYIITNDKRSHRRMIIERYYFRFEIEEFFKDAKWLQGLEFTRFLKIESITTLLWFILIGWWCFNALASVLSAFSIPHPKARISRFRHFTESLLRVKNFLLLAALGYDSV